MKNGFQVSRIFRNWTITATAGLALVAGPVAFSQAAPASDSAETTFKKNCVMCHGADGGGSALGKRFQVPDLRSKEVQSQSSAELAKVITNGKEKMPAFGNRLDSAQIQGLVDYLRHLPGAAPATK